MECAPSHPRNCAICCEYCRRVEEASEWARREPKVRVSSAGWRNVWIYHCNWPIKMGGWVQMTDVGGGGEGGDEMMEMGREWDGSKCWEQTGRSVLIVPRRVTIGSCVAWLDQPPCESFAATTTGWRSVADSERTNASRYMCGKALGEGGKYRKRCPRC